MVSFLTVVSYYRVVCIKAMAIITGDHRIYSKELGRKPDERTQYTTEIRKCILAVVVKQELEIGYLSKQLDDLSITLNKMNRDLQEIESHLTIEDDVLNDRKNENKVIEKRHQNDCEYLDKQFDDLEQCGRRPCLRLKGIPTYNYEKQETIEDTVRSCLAEMGVEHCVDDIDRVIFTGRVRYNEFSSEQPNGHIMVQFKSWDSLCAVYKARRRLKREHLIGNFSNLDDKLKPDCRLDFILELDDAGN